MAKRSLILTSTSAKGSRMSKAISDINPTAAGDVLLTFAQKLNNLTTNTYVKTDCVDKINLDTDAAALDSRQTPTLTGHALTGTVDSGGALIIDCNTNSDGAVWAALKTETVLNAYVLLYSTGGTGIYEFKVFMPADAAKRKPFTVIVNVEGSETYKPVTLELNYDKDGRPIENG